MSGSLTLFPSPNEGGSSGTLDTWRHPSLGKGKVGIHLNAKFGGSVAGASPDSC